MDTHGAFASCRRGRIMLNAIAIGCQVPSFEAAASRGHRAQTLRLVCYLHLVVVRPTTHRIRLEVLIRPWSYMLFPPSLD